MQGTDIGFVAVMITHYWRAGVKDRALERQIAREYPHITLHEYVEAWVKAEYEMEEFDDV